MKTNFHTKVLWLGMKDAYSNLPFLQKYAPKYYSEVEFEIADLQNPQILSKTRCIKIIRSAKIEDYSQEKKGLVLKALRRKAKTLQNLKGAELDLYENFPKLQQFRLLTESRSSWRAFLSLKHLKSLTVESVALEIETAGNMKAFELFKWRFWAHVLEMKSLKHLSCNFYGIITTSNYQFLQKLGSFGGFLSSLKTLILDLNFLEDQNLEVFNLDQLYRHIKVLRAKELSPSVFTKFLGNFQFYQNLQELSVLQVMILEEEESPQPSLICLKNFHFLNELKSLELSFDFSAEKDFVCFLENFCLPPNIKNICLSFQELTLDDAKEIISSDSYFLFCQKWKNIGSLNSLSFTFFESSNVDCSTEFNLILPILKTIPRLLSLYFSSSNEINEETNENLINFQSLWDSIPHLKPTLKTLYLESAFISIQDVDIEVPSEVLKNLSLCGKLIGEDQMPSLFKLLSEDCKSQLFLEAFAPNSKEKLIQLLKYFKLIPAHLKVCIHISMASLDVDDVTLVLCSEDHVALKIRHKENVKLGFCNIEKLEQESLERIVNTFEERGILCCLQISDQGGNVLFSGENWDEM